MVQVVSQGEIVANSLLDYMQRHPEMNEKCTRGGSIRYYSTESVEKFISSASIFLKENIVAERFDLGWIGIGK